jgi:hypothetical protein
LSGLLPSGFTIPRAVEIHHRGVWRKFLYHV